MPGSPLSATDGDGRADRHACRSAQTGISAPRIAINGQTVDALVDTGATTTVLTRPMPARAGFDLGRAELHGPGLDRQRQCQCRPRRRGRASASAPFRSENTAADRRRGRPLEQSLLGMNFIGSAVGLRRARRQADPARLAVEADEEARRHEQAEQPEADLQMAASTASARS